MVTKTVKIRTALFLLFVVLSMVLTACSSGTSSSSEAVELDFSHFFPPNHEQETVVVQQFIKEVEEATDGRVQITSYPGATLAAPDGQYDAAATGAVDISLSVHSYTPNQFPLTSVMELPFLSQTGTDGSRALWTLYEEFEEIQTEYAETVPLWVYTSEPGQIFMVGDPIKSVEDLKGKTIRSPSTIINEWLTAMGATPVSMSMNDTYEAMERGVVDGTVGPWHTLLDYSLHEVVDSVTVGNFYLTTFFVTMNEDSWDSLGEENQKALEDIIGEHMAAVAGGNFDNRMEEAKQTAADNGLEIYELSQEEMKQWEPFLQPTIDNWIKKMEDQGLPGQAVYNRAVELSEN